MKYQEANVVNYAKNALQCEMPYIYNSNYSRIQGDYDMMKIKYRKLSGLTLEIHRLPDRYEATAVSPISVRPFTIHHQIQLLKVGIERFVHRFESRDLAAEVCIVEGHQHTVKSTYT